MTRTLQSERHFRFIVPYYEDYILKNTFFLFLRLVFDIIQAFYTAFLESNDFESAIRLAISLGGDSDTLACITGSIAKAFYGIPKWIREESLSRLTDDLRSIVLEFEKVVNRYNEK